jgi:hypothetical protein
VDRRRGEPHAATAGLLGGAGLRGYQQLAPVRPPLARGELGNGRCWLTGAQSWPGWAAEGLDAVDVPAKLAIWLVPFHRHGRNNDTCRRGLGRRAALTAFVAERARLRTSDRVLPSQSW